jgi:hypothetical protein
MLLLLQLKKAKKQHMQPTVFPCMASEQTPALSILRTPSYAPRLSLCTTSAAAVAVCVCQVTAAEWDALVAAQAEVNPFLKWAFLHALEASKSAVSCRSSSGRAAAALQQRISSGATAAAAAAQQWR